MDIRSAIDADADSVQSGFTQGRLCCKLDPSRGLLREFVALEIHVLARFSDAERARIGVHTCAGVDARVARLLRRNAKAESRSGKICRNARLMTR